MFMALFLDNEQAYVKPNQKKSRGLRDTRDF